MKTAAAHAFAEPRMQRHRTAALLALAVAGLACHGGLATSTAGGTGTQPDTGVPPDGDAATCDFHGSYEYGAIGGRRARRRPIFLSPGNQYTHTRTALLADAGAALSCSPAMPPCGSDDVITAYDVEVHDLPAADVQDALAQAAPPLYGVDTRPSDGSVFEFKRADGRGFLVGAPCAGATPCVAIPAGIERVRQALGKSRHATAPRVRVRCPPRAVVD